MTDDTKSMTSAPTPATALRPRVGLPWAILAVVAVTAFFVSNRDNLRPKQFAVVEKGKIYRSASLTPAMLRRVVEQNDIKTVIDLGAHEPGTPEEALAQRTAESLKLTRFTFDLEGDGRGNPNFYVQAMRLMNDPAKQPVLVHCSAGAQRTGCLVGFHRMINQNALIDDVMAEADRFRDRPEKNPHLRAMLVEWAEPIKSALRTSPQAQIQAIPGASPLPAPQPGIKTDAQGGQSPAIPAAPAPRKP
jgi:protein tyrosine phosphatase (PTP) superfamily phosphohydrolase (DUF442 family)